MSISSFEVVLPTLRRRAFIAMSGLIPKASKIGDGLQKKERKLNREKKNINKLKKEKKK